MKSDTCPKLPRALEGLFTLSKTSLGAVSSMHKHSGSRTKTPQTKTPGHKPPDKNPLDKTPRTKTPQTRHSFQKFYNFCFQNELWKRNLNLVSSSKIRKVWVYKVVHG